MLADGAAGKLVELAFEDEASTHLFTEDKLELLLDASHNGGDMAFPLTIEITVSLIIRDPHLNAGFR